MIVYLALMIISIYFTARLFVTMVIVSSNSLRDEEIRLSQSYKEAKNRTWRYIGISILFGLILFIPILLTYSGISGDIPWVIRVGLLTFGLLPTVYLGTIFYFSTYAAALCPKETSVFTYSKQLVKGNFFKVFILILIPIAIMAPANVCDFYRYIDTTSIGVQLGYSFLKMILNMLLVPFATLLAVASMERLAKTE